jgi:hypothetical protein
MSETFVAGACPELSRRVCFVVRKVFVDLCSVIEEFALKE